MTEQTVVTRFSASERRPPAKSPSVLVIDPDRDFLDQCARFLDDLSYSYKCVTSAREALKTVIQDQAIEILLVSERLPDADGLVLIDDVRARIGFTRPLAIIILANRISTELALKSMYVEAVDLLSKPLAFDAYSSALRRATQFVETRRVISDVAAISSFGERLESLVAMLAAVSDDTATGTVPGDKELEATLRVIIGARSLRSRFFPSQIFGDPAWDILLDLARAKLEGQQVSVSSVCIAAAVPMSTALRWVKQMIDANLLRRWTDPKDRRRDLIALTEPTSDRMREYLTMAHKSFSTL